MTESIEEKIKPKFSKEEVRKKIDNCLNRGSLYKTDCDGGITLCLLAAYPLEYGILTEKNCHFLGDPIIEHTYLRICHKK